MKESDLGARPRLRTPEECEAEWRFRSAWDEVLLRLGDDEPDGPLSTSHRSALDLVDHWKSRALAAEQKAEEGMLNLLEELCER